jgi:transcriptional regulator with XRE-family HTH domain
MKPSTNPRLLEALAAEIKARRQELRLTQEELASRCELDRPYLSLIEVARKQPSLSVLWKIAAGLEWNLSDLTLRLERRYEQEERVRRRTEKAGAGANAGRTARTPKKT